MHFFRLTNKTYFPGSTLLLIASSYTAKCWPDCHARPYTYLPTHRPSFPPNTSRQIATEVYPLRRRKICQRLRKNNRCRYMGDAWQHGGCKAQGSLQSREGKVLRISGKYQSTIQVSGRLRESRTLGRIKRLGGKGPSRFCSRDRGQESEGGSRVREPGGERRWADYTISIAFR